MNLRLASHEDIDTLIKPRFDFFAALMEDDSSNIVSMAFLVIFENPYIKSLAFKSLLPPILYQ